MAIRSLKLSHKLVLMGYKRNAEGPNNPKSVLWYMDSGKSANERHEDHVHVSNINGTKKSSTDKKDDSAVTKYYWTDGKTNWDDFFTVTEDEENLTITLNKHISAAAVDLTVDNYDHQIAVNSDAYKFFIILYKLLNEDNAETYFSNFKSGWPVWKRDGKWINGDDEEGAAEYLNAAAYTALDKTGFIGRGNYADEAAVASMNMHAMYTYIVPHIRKLILNDNTGKVTFPFMNIVKTTSNPIVQPVTKTITWNYM